MDIELLKADEQGIAVITVYTSDKPGRDAQGDVISGDDLWKGMAGWAGRRRLRLQHDTDLPDGAVVCLGSMMTGGKAYRGDGYTVPANTWALTLQFDLASADGPRLWGDLREGRLGGLSMHGEGDTVVVEEYQP